MKTLLFLATHFIDEAVISEYRKMKNTPGVDAILVINNDECQFEFKNRVEDKIFFETGVKCFFFDSSLNDEMQLPQFVENDNRNFSKTTYRNGDSKFYYVRKFLMNYDFYWGMEYDVFCNAKTYAGFLKKFADNRADLLIQGLDEYEKNINEYHKGTDWIYNDLKKIYVGVFPVVRLSAQAIDFLYQRRLEHRAIFENSDVPDKQWLFCEVFVPTELTKHGFICESLNEPRVKFLPHIYLNDERIFLNPDDHLYHPVKSVNAEISKMKNLYAELFFYFRKNFLIHLYEKLTSISTINLKDLPVQFDENFHSMTLDLSAQTGGGAEACAVKLGF